MKKQSRTHKGKGLNLEDWLDREEEKRQLGERTLPINEMDDILPIYDTDGLPFEEYGVFNDVDGMTAPPSEATILKSLDQKYSIYAGMPPLTIGESTLNDALYGVTDYHEAMIDNILREQYFKGNTFKFRDKPKSPRKIDAQAFEYVQRLREFYKIDEEDTYDRRDLKGRVIKNKKPLPTTLAVKVLALEDLNRNWFKGYLPFRTYEAIKEQAEQSLELADARYKKDTGKNPEPVRKRLLEQTIEDLRKGKF